MEESMESRAKFMGHPVHPMLIVFPLGLLISAVVFDVLYLLTEIDILPAVSFFNISAGLIMGALAAVFGLRDYLSITPGTRARAVGRWHGLGNAVVMGLFALSWLLRRGEPNYEPSTLAFLLGLAGVTLGTVTAWFGGELVDRLGVGVDPGANLNAPSSLSGQPAYANLHRTGASAGVPGDAAAVVPVTGEEQDIDSRENSGE
jgi:uncharacterized membrane protein